MSDELYAELCSAMPQVEMGEGDDTTVTAGLSGTLATPLLMFVLNKLRELTCQRKDEVIAVAQKWIAENVKSTLVQRILTAAVEAAVNTVCVI